MFDDFLCVIPARAGSKGITNKNKRPVSGIPLAIYSIRAAIEAGIPHDNIVLSTNDSEIETYGRAWGIVVRQRPDILCDDNASSESALLDAIDNHPFKNSAKHIVMLQPTSPIRFRDRLKDCIIKYYNGDYDSLLTVTKFPNMFWYKTYDEITNSHSWVSNYRVQNRKMKQNLSSEDFVYFDNGNIYITNIDVLRQTNCRIGSKPCIMVTSYIEGIQIDNSLEMVSVDKILDGKGCGFLRQTEEELSDDSN